jgi:hypothetical protein
VNEEHIGTATMDRNGTIVLRLRATAESGIIGHAKLIYPAAHRRYQEIVRHVGDLRPGETKLVAPWPDSK